MDPVTNPGSVSPGGAQPPSVPPTMPLPGYTPALHLGAPAPAGHPPAGAHKVDTSWAPPATPAKPGQAGQAEGQAPQKDQPLVQAPSVAEDGDVIEKEWVTRAKRIVAMTRQDPYKQTNELHKYRSEYLKKRYNKIIKPTE